MKRLSVRCNAAKILYPFEKSHWKEAQPSLRSDEHLRVLGALIWGFKRQVGEFPTELKPHTEFLFWEGIPVIKSGGESELGKIRVKNQKNQKNQKHKF